MGRNLVVVFLLAALGCGPSSDPSVDAQTVPMFTELVGDWFLCDSADCSVLRNVGATWGADGRWGLLQARSAQSLDPTGTYCASVHDANRGPYTFDVDSGALAMTDDLGRDAGAGTFTFTEPTAVFVLPNGQTSRYMRIDPPRGTGSCPVP